MNCGFTFPLMIKDKTGLSQEDSGKIKHKTTYCPFDQKCAQTHTTPNIIMLVYMYFLFLFTC